MPLIIKLVLLGDAGVGKTCLITVWNKKGFRCDQQSTIGAAFVQHDFNYQGEIHKLQIWDTAGQERYHSMAPIYSEGAHGALLVFDLTHRETLEHLPTWRSSLQKCRPDIPIFVVGNKNDLARERQVSWTDGSSFAEQLGFRYFETSARNGDGVDQTFEEIAQAAIELTAGKATEASNPGKPKKSGCC